MNARAPLRLLRYLLQSARASWSPPQPEVLRAIDPELARKVAKLERDTELCGFPWPSGSTRCVVTHAEFDAGCASDLCPGAESTQGCGRWRNP